jgi:hypothetical protein
MDEYVTLARALVARKRLDAGFGITDADASEVSDVPPALTAVAVNA